MSENKVPFKCRLLGHDLVPIDTMEKIAQCSRCKNKFNYKWNATGGYMTDVEKFDPFARKKKRW